MLLIFCAVLLVEAGKTEIYGKYKRKFMKKSAKAYDIGINFKLFKKTPLKNLMLRNENR